MGGLGRGAFACAWWWSDCCCRATAESAAAMAWLTASLSTPSNIVTAEEGGGGGRRAGSWSVVDSVGACEADGSAAPSAGGARDRGEDGAGSSLMSEETATFGPSARRSEGFKCAGRGRLRRRLRRAWAAHLTHHHHHQGGAVVHPQAHRDLLMQHGESVPFCRYVWRSSNLKLQTFNTRRGCLAARRHDNGEMFKSKPNIGNRHVFFLVLFFYDQF